MNTRYSTQYSKLDRTKYDLVLLNTGEVIARKIIPLPELKIGDRIKVFCTSAKYFESSLMFIATIDRIDTFASKPHYACHSDNGDRHAFWPSSLMRIVKDV